MIYVLKVFKQDKRTKAGERFINSYEYDRKDDKAMQREVKELNWLYSAQEGYRLEFAPKTKIVKNLMTGQDVEIDADTPWCCNPASETYWSM